MIVLVLIISFLLDGIIFSLTSINDVIAPLFSLLALIITYPYYRNKSKKIYLSAAIVGMLYDIVYTNSLFLNTLVFIGLMYLVDKMYKTLTNNFVNTFIVSTVVICLYRILIYLCFFVLGIIDWNITEVIMSIANSLIINYIYIIIFYFAMYAISKKLRINRNA